MKKHIFKQWNMILGAFLMLALMLVPSHQLQAAATGTIHIIYAPVEGATFHLYKVADYDGNGNYELTDDFADCTVVLSDKAAPATLEGYAQSKELEPLVTVTTDAEGKIDITDLEEGYYLLSGDNYVYGDKIYMPSPSLIPVPSADSDGNATYDIEVDLDKKYTTEPYNTDSEYSSISVKKVWSDSDDKYDARPESIEVQLLCDGDVVSTVTLNSDNNWSYEWVPGDDLELAKDCKWTVVEKTKLSLYTNSVSVADSEEDTIVFVVKNTYTTSTKPSSSSSSGTSSGSSSGSSSKLPQTGQLWWPVLILLCAGLFSLICGVLLVRKKEDK